MTALCSSSIGYAYQLLFILYHGKPAIFFCSFLNLSVYCQRLCCLGLTISAVILRLASDFSSAILSSSMCIVLSRLAVVFFCATVVFTSLLFFFRTRAVLILYPWVVAFFAILWLAVLGGCLAFIVDIFEPLPVDPASCINSTINPFVAAATIIPLINDTLVFLAISWRLSRNSYDSYTLEGSVRCLISGGDYLPLFSKALLQDGQAYYLLALSWSISHA